MESKTSVPKFSSFQRKRGPEKDDPAEEPLATTSATRADVHISRRDKDKDKDKPRKRSKYDEEEEKNSRRDSRIHVIREHSKHHQKHYRRSRSRSSENTRSGYRRRDVVDPPYNEHGSRKQDQQAQASDWDDSSRPYFIDRKGDLSNVKYGGPNRYSVPPYHRAGYGFVIGLPGTRRINLNLSSDKHVVLTVNGASTRPERRILSKRLTQNLAKPGRVLQAPIENEVDIQTGNADFICVSDNNKRKRDLESPGEAGEESSNKLIQGTGLTWQSEASDAENLEDHGSDEEFPASQRASQIKERHSELLKQTKSNPRHVESWIQLVEHQEDVMRLDREASAERLNKAEIRNLSEIKISIYEQALRHTRGDPDGHIALLIGLLKEGDQIWESKKISDRWSQALEDFPERINLWMSYLDFAQTNFLEFRLDTAREYCLQCLRILSKTIQSNNDATIQSTNSRRMLMYVFARLTRLVSEAGYHEQALAVWQAVIEYAFFQPTARSEMPGDAQFEEFWDSEVARVGEPGALGWGKFVKDMPPVEPKSNTPIHGTSAKDLLPNFYELERAHGQSLELPGRTADEAAEVDPYHVILFSDIASYLPLLNSSISKSDILASFLAFFDLPQLHNASESAINRTDPFLRKAEVKTLAPKSAPATESETANLNGFTQSLVSMTKFPLRNVQGTVEDLFEDAFDFFDDFGKLAFIRMVLHQIMNVWPDETLIEYYIAFLAQFYTKEAPKVAEELLKSRPSSLRLYNAYALAVDKARIEGADRVLSTALSMSKSLPPDIQKDTVLLWRTRIWKKLRTADTSTAFTLLISMGNPEVSANPSASVGYHLHTPAAFLKSKTMLLHARDECFANQDLWRGVLYAECLALLLYLHHSDGISEALAVFHNTYAVFSQLKLTTSTASEAMHQAQARLLAYHGVHSKSFKPSVIRDELTESLRIFPDNTLFLKIFAANEARFRIDDRVRSLMSQTMDKTESSSIVNWLFSIFTEIQRGEYGGSTSHSVRATFEHAVTAPKVKHNPSLWSSYIHFEFNEAVKAKTPSAIDRVKRVFFQGLTHLPWCKAYMMLAFAPGLVDAMSVTELRRVWNVMGEKEIRVFVDLEDGFDMWGFATGTLNLPDDKDSD